MSMGMDISGRKALRHPKVRYEGISLRLLDLSVGNFLLLQRFVSRSAPDLSTAEFIFNCVPLVQDGTK
jgi:hypothetical protein